MNDENKKDIKNETEIKNDCEYKLIHKDDIKIPSWIPRKPEMKTQEDIELSESIKSGLINPITVRPTDNGKFELIAGSRRLAASGENVWVGIQKGKSEYAARRITGDENEHRLDLPDVVRDDFYYTTYILGIKEGEIKNMRDMANDFSMKIDKLRRYISAGEERAKHKDDNVISKASTSVLCNTKKLDHVQKIRKKILEMEQQKIVTQKNIAEITKRIETCMDKGMTETMVTKMIDMSIPSGIHMNDGNVKNVLPFNMDEFDTISSIMVISPPDVRENIISKKIDIRDALEINKFEKVEERRQLVEEKIKLDKMKKKSVETLDKEWDNNIVIRNQQVQDIKNNGDTRLKTRFDVDFQHKLDLAKDADNRHDEDYFRRYRNLKDELNRTILYFHPKKMKTDKGKESIAAFIRNMYEILHLVMIEIGEIKTGEGNTEENFGHHFVDVEAKVTEE